MTVVLGGSDGYPVSYEKGYTITGFDRFAGKDDYICFHAGTAFAKNMDPKSLKNGASGDDIVTNGGRVLDITALGKDIREARSKAYEATSGYILITNI